jgi:hypothetical protein
MARHYTKDDLGIAIVKEYGAKGDGVSRPLSTVFTTLVLAQMKYPFATALTQELDWAGIQLALNSSTNVFIPKGKYNISDTLVFRDFTTLTLEGVDTRYSTGEENVAVLTAKANVRLMELGDACQVLGGKLTAIDFAGYDKSMIYIDFSTKNRSDIHIETSLRGRSVGNAIEIYGNGNGGTAHPIFINSNIMNFDVAVKGTYVGGTCWCTGINVDSTITNCVQSVNLDGVGAGGDLLGSYQPTFTGTRTDRGVVELKNAGHFNIHAKIWDMNQAINNYSVVLRNSTENDISKRIDVRQILNLSLKPLYAPINNTFPSGAYTFYDRISGNNENMLFGANSKYTVTPTASANISLVTNSNYDQYGMFKMEGKPTYMSPLAAGALTPTEMVEFEVLFPEASKRILVAGFSFWSHVPPVSYKIHVKETDNSWTLVDSGIPSDKIHISGGVHDTAISVKVGDYAKVVNGIRFTFEVSKANAVVIDSAWAKSGNQNEAYLPLHGGKIYGDVDMNNRYLTIGKVVSLPTASATYRGKQIRTEGVTGVAEVSTLNITSGCTTQGNITINLGGTPYTINLTTADNTADLVATKIRAIVATGWTLSGSGQTVIFTKNSTGVVSPDATYTVGSTGATGAMTTTTQGVTSTADAVYTCVKRSDDTYEWIQTV